MKELHVADVVEVYLILEDNRQSLAIQPDSKNGGRKCEFADG